MPRPGQSLLHVSVPSASVSPTPPLPASVSTRALWRSEQGTSGSPLQTWLDAVNSIPLAQATSSFRPLVAADSTHFNARPVVQTDLANNRHMSTAVLGSPLWSAGAKPWILSVMRLRNPSPPGHSRCYQAGDGGAGGPYDISIVSDTNIAVAQVANANAVQADVLSVPRLIGNGINAAGQNEMVVDGVSRGTAGSGLTAGQCSLISIGAYMGPAQFNDVSLAMLWLLSARPTAPEEAAILAWSRAYYGTP